MQSALHYLDSIRNFLRRAQQQERATLAAQASAVHRSATWLEQAVGVLSNLMSVLELCSTATLLEQAAGFLEALQPDQAENLSLLQ